MLLPENSLCFSIRGFVLCNQPNFSSSFPLNNFFKFVTHPNQFRLHGKNDKSVAILPVHSACLEAVSSSNPRVASGFLFFATPRRLVSFVSLRNSSSFSPFKYSSPFLSNRK